MADDYDMGVFGSADIGGGILFYGTRSGTQIMEARNRIVEPRQGALCQINAALVIQDVQFAPTEDSHALDFIRNHLKISKIDFLAASRHRRGMVGDPEDGKLFLGCGVRHFAERGVSVSAGNGMCVQICKV